MKTNETPRYDSSVNTTGCCPKFNPAGWDEQEMHFEAKPFVVASTRSLMHIPVNMGSVFKRVHGHIKEAQAVSLDQFVVLSRETTPWHAEHFFAVTKPVPGEEMTTLSGDFVTKIFEGPYRKAKDWYEEMCRLVHDRGREPGDVYFFYTTCPKCAQAYGKNYVVGVAKL